MQMLADVTRRRIETVPDPKEAGAVGAALVAAVGLGIYPSFEALESVTRVERTFEPREENFATYGALFECFRDSYGRLRPLYRRLNENTSGSVGFDEEVSP
jgi:xylulokinase